MKFESFEQEGKIDAEEWKGFLIKEVEAGLGGLSEGPLKDVDYE